MKISTPSPYFMLVLWPSFCIHRFIPSGKVQFCHPRSFSWPSRNTALNEPLQEKFLFLSFFEDGRGNSIPSGFLFYNILRTRFLDTCTSCYILNICLVSMFPSGVMVITLSKKCNFCSFELTLARNPSISKVFHKMALFIMLWHTVSEILVLEVEEFC